MEEFPSLRNSLLRPLNFWEPQRSQKFLEAYFRRYHQPFCLLILFEIEGLQEEEIIEL